MFEQRPRRDEIGVVLDIEARKLTSNEYTIH
jgi:hypothetical protein